MLLDDLRDQLKQLEPDITAIKTFWANAGSEAEYARLKSLTEQEEFWRDPKQVEVSQSLQRVRGQRDSYQAVTEGYAELSELIELFSTDETELARLAPEIKELAHKVAEFKITLLLNEQDDAANCFLNINAGAGGTESMDWASMLLRMYVRFCEENGFNASILDYQAAEQAGIKSATLLIKGKNAYGLLRSENGVHRLVRISPYDAAKRRHTSFAAVSTMPEVVEQTVTIDPNDLRIDTYRAGGAGGQHVNKTESAVRITHLPTNIVVQCQDGRSQHQNKDTAMKMLMARLAQKQKEEKLAHAASIEKKNIEWGSQIRSYVLHPYKMVKDHRTDHESPQPDKVLDGELMPFIESYLLSQAKKN